MIKLENISIYGSDNFFVSWIKRIGMEEMDFIIENNLEDFEKLENMIREGKEVPIYFIKLYELTKKYINKPNILEKQPQIYSSNNLCDIDKRDLEVTENEVLVKNLILNVILDDGWRVTFLDIAKLNMKSLRYFLSHTMPDGNMCLKLFPKVGNKSLERVIKGLYYYEEQIKRQYRENHVIGTNLFTLNREAKQSIVERELAKYIEYLLYFSDDFIWGKRSVTGNKLLEDCLIKEKEANINSRDRLIEVFTNYMTLQELENNPVENHTLDRFMLKKNIEKEYK